MRAVLCLLALFWLSVSSPGLAQPAAIAARSKAAASPKSPTAPTLPTAGGLAIGQIEGAQLKCDAGDGAGVADCKLTPGAAPPPPPAAASSGEQAARILTIPLQSTPLGLQPQVQADGKPFSLVCEPAV